MVGHEAVGPHPQPEPSHAVGKKVQVEAAIPVGLEDPASEVASLGHVVGMPDRDDPRHACHCAPFSQSCAGVEYV